MTCAGWIVAAVLAGACAPVAMAVPPEELKSQCRDWLESAQTPAAAACESYLAGFLDGLRADARLHLLPASKGAESWSERAIRTRLSRAQRARVQHGEYCIQLPVPMRDIVNSLLTHLDAAIRRSDETASDAVEATLRQNYRCL